MTAATSTPSPRRAERMTARAWALLLVVCGALFLEGIDIAMLNVAVPVITDDLGVADHDAHWIISADVLGYAQGLASQNYGNFYNRLAGLANVGQTTATSLGQFGANAASNIGNAYGNIGNARASSYQARGDANSQLGGLVAGFGSNLLNNWGGWNSTRNQTQSAQNGFAGLQASNNPFAVSGGNAWASPGYNWNFGGG